MSKQKFIFSLLTAVASVGLASFPVLAQVNSNQGAGQTAAINGDNNTIIQIINQTNRQQNRRGQINRRQAPYQRRDSNRDQDYGISQNSRRDRGNHYGHYKKYRNNNRWYR
ncbi:hypothetical protein IQ259_06585 [Fortiea sp. LEGE XX443]|uniref:hypothetical protein n=1 Tax=Fortiea sp. LEGE XX443 TaxID=1828611 RepID=UPI00187EB7A5|nr:hypothetical protein [Fortiea sp. LEGE XX443]MBE9004706.1 hypothetical protein [Fortiea sp. LEGE XX443]